MYRVTYLDSAVESLGWFFDYYLRVFPEGGTAAAEHLLETEALLQAHPLSGRLGTVAGVRERRVKNTPFNLVYQVRGEEIEVLFVRDTRGG